MKHQDPMHPGEPMPSQEPRKRRRRRKHRGARRFFDILLGILFAALVAVALFYLYLLVTAWI